VSLYLREDAAPLKLCFDDETEDGGARGREVARPRRPLMRPEYSGSRTTPALPRASSPWRGWAALTNGSCPYKRKSLSAYAARQTSAHAGPGTALPCVYESGFSAPPLATPPPDVAYYRRLRQLAPGNADRDTSWCQRAADGEPTRCVQSIRGLSGHRKRQSLSAHAFLASLPRPLALARRRSDGTGELRERHNTNNYDICQQCFI